MSDLFRDFIVNLNMSTAFQQTLSQAQALSRQEQMALIAALSQVLAESGSVMEVLDGVLPTKDEQEILSRIEAYEKGASKTISGEDFREMLREKYAS